MISFDFLQIFNVVAVAVVVDGSVGRQIFMLNKLSGEKKVAKKATKTSTINNIDIITVAITCQIWTGLTENKYSPGTFAASALTK